MSCEGCGQSGQSEAMDYSEMDLDGDGTTTEEEVRAFGEENGLSVEEIEELVEGLETQGSTASDGASPEDQAGIEQAGIAMAS